MASYRWSRGLDGWTKTMAKDDGHGTFTSEPSFAVPANLSSFGIKNFEQIKTLIPYDVPDHQAGSHEDVAESSPFLMAEDIARLTNTNCMSSRTKPRNAANSVDSATLSMNERILRDCHALYVDPENGLVKIAESLDLHLLPPRKKIVVLLIGNHSAGKSSFINWYIEEHVQKTGVAIETQGFALVTSGKKRESLTGNATLHLYPHFKPLQKIKGVVDYLTTEISTSRQKKFSLVTFIDTPGLVDGDMKYPYDVNETLLWLGQMADLIFVFFDPIGQALCKRTLNLVEALNAKFVDKMRFYLSKADEAGHEADRQKVMMQIVQELCKRPGLNRCGFDMPTIYIPNANKAVRCMNQIEEVCKDIEKTISQTVQNTLNTLEHDCELLANEAQQRISADNQSRSENFSTGGRGLCLGLFGLVVPLLLMLNLALRSTSEARLYSLLGAGTADLLLLFTLPLELVSGILPESIRFAFVLMLFSISAVFLLIAKLHSRFKPTLTKKQKRALQETHSYLTNFVKPKKQRLYQEYLRQSVADYDL